MVVRGDANAATEKSHRGQAAFEQYVRPKLRPEDDGKYVAIDIETGDYEINPDDYVVCRRMRDHYPAERLWLVRVGYEAAERIRTPRPVSNE